MRRVFVALTFVFLVTTLVLAWGKIHEANAHRDAAASGLTPAVAALERRFVETVSDGADALRAWDGSGAPAAPLARAEIVRASAPPESVPVAGLNARV